MITRRLGACQRCHKNRSRVGKLPSISYGKLLNRNFQCDMSENMYEPCACCMKVIHNLYLRKATNYHHQPCIRIDLLDLHLHRKGEKIVLSHILKQMSNRCRPHNSQRPSGLGSEQAILTGLSTFKRYSRTVSQSGIRKQCAQINRFSL